MKNSDIKDSTIHIFRNEVEKHSAFQPIDIKPTFGKDWILNGPNNKNYKTYKDAYDDSPTNNSIINSFVNYIYGEGLTDTGENKIDLSIYLSEEDALLICQDFKKYGGYAIQIIWNSSVKSPKPLKIEYLPVFKLGANYVYETAKVNGWWFSWDWSKMFTYRPKMYPVFDGKYKNKNLEVSVIRRPTEEPFFPVPNYLAGIPWAQVEGELANGGINHFKNAMSDITVLNYNQGRQTDAKTKQEEADKARSKIVGTDNQSTVIVSFNDGAEEALIVDRISPPELNQQNVFYAEEAEKKIIVAHSAPPILFSGTNTGGGFSSNADEIEVATNALYRRHINPDRKVILRGLAPVFRLIDPSIKLDFADFVEEKVEEKVDSEITEHSSDKITFLTKLLNKW